jgi:hypothetical protein
VLAFKSPLSISLAYAFAMKSLLFIIFLFTFISGCSDCRSKKEDYVELIPVKTEKPENNKMIMDEICIHKNELEKLNLTHKYVIDETNELN